MGSCEKAPSACSNGSTSRRMSVIKEVSSKWLLSTYDHIKSHPDIVQNGFRKAGIPGALENELTNKMAIENREDDPSASDTNSG